MFGGTCYCSLQVRRQRGRTSSEMLLFIWVHGITSQKPVTLIPNKSYTVFLRMDDETNTVELAGLIPGAYRNVNIIEKLDAYKKKRVYVPFFFV